MKTVISASRRTDIPAFYLDWFTDKIRQGHIDLTNPFNPQQKKRISLLPQDVEWIVFWSRNYARFLEKRSEFKDFNLFFHFTILPKSDLEKAGIPLSSALKQLNTLAELYGPEHIIWRYDPLVYWYEYDKLQTNHSIQEFKQLCFEVSQTKVRQCYISFAHPYKKFEDRMRKKFPQRKIYHHSIENKLLILQEMNAAAKQYKIQLYSCSNEDLLIFPEIAKGHCINGSLLNKLSHNKNVSEAKAPSRPGCGCTKSIDIGSYVRQPCHFGCIYCYANPVWE